MIATEERGHHLDDAHCADLALGLTPEPERSQALAHLAECAACEARLRSHVAAGERAWFDAPGRVPTAQRVVPLPSRRVWVLAAAAALAVVFVTPQFLSHGDHANSGRNTLILPAPGAEVRTREGGMEDAHLTAGLAAYAARDFASAERELLAAKASGSSETLRRLYLAQVRMARGDASTAVTLLRAIEWRTVPEPWRRDGVTLLARALRATGADISADSIEHALRTLDPATPFVP